VGKTKLPKGTALFILGFLLLIVLVWAHQYLLFWLARLCLLGLERIAAG